MVMWLAVMSPIKSQLFKRFVIIFASFSGGLFVYHLLSYEILFRFPAKSEVSVEVSDYLKVHRPEFLVRGFHVIPVYFERNNCLLVRPKENFAYNEKGEIVLCFDQKWRGKPQRLKSIVI